jgi:hypothetical protein
MNTVVEQWVSELSYKMQTVLLAGFRGCDGKNKEDVSKPLSRYLRSIILKNADITTKFMVDDIMHNEIDAFIEDIDSYPMHWLLHFTHACEIVGYKHPEIEVRKKFNNIYNKICWQFHMNPETEPQLDFRLYSPGWASQTSENTILDP